MSHQWTRDPPPADGLYWWQRNPDSPAELVRLDRGVVTFVNPACRWAGPIPEPGEPGG